MRLHARLDAGHLASLGNGDVGDGGGELATIPGIFRPRAFKGADQLDKGFGWCDDQIPRIGEAAHARELITERTASVEHALDGPDHLDVQGTWRDERVEQRDVPRDGL